MESQKNITPMPTDPLKELLTAGEMALSGGHTEEACTHFRAALRIAPAHSGAALKLGIALMQTGHAGEAVKILQALTRKHPDNALAWNAQGSALRHAGNPAAAIEAHEQVLLREPENIAALTGRGLAKLAEQKFVEAQSDLRRVIKLGGNLAELHFGYGLASYLQGQLASAETAWLSVLTLENPTLAWHLAELALRQEEWPRAWVLAEARFLRCDHPAPRHHTSIPAWDGAPLMTGKLVLWGDQGLGEQLMFARFIAASADRVGRLELQVAAPLVRLLSSAFPEISVAPLGKEDASDAVRQQALGSLPRVLGLTHNAVLAARAHYLQIPSATQDRWSARLRQKTRPRIGLAWAGNANHGDDLTRSIGLQALTPLMRLADRCQFHSLQTGLRSADLAGSTYPIIDWSAQLADFLDLAGLIAQLDLVITADTAVAHLAGTLGCTVWLLIPFTPDWRWSEKHGQETLWYPTARLFRQPAPASWPEVIAEVQAQLSTYLPATAIPDNTPEAFADDHPDLEQCIARLSVQALDQTALSRLADLAATLADPQPALPPLHRGRSHLPAALALARLLVRIDKKKVALDIFRAVSTHQPGLLQVWLNRSDLARQLRHASEAIEAARQAIKLAPDDADAWLHLANALHEDKATTEALAAIEHAAKLNPDSSSIHNNHGVFLKEQGHVVEAIAAYQRALAISPEHLAAITNLGSAWREQGELDRSLDCFRKALAADPNNAETWFGLGNTLKEMARTREAIKAFRQALTIKPEHLEVQVNLSLLLMLAGEFGPGWDMYEQRFLRPKSPVRARRFPQPRWEGQPLAGERLLVWGEQGAGDRLMGASLFKELLAEGAELIVETDPSLLRLMQHNFPGIAWVVESSPADPQTALATLQAPILSLPRHRRRDLAKFANAAPYLAPPDNLRAEWETRLAAFNGKKIGLVWAGSPSHHNDAKRSLELTQLAPLLTAPNCSFISLQIGKEARQIAASALPVHDLSGLIKDYADTAALIAQLDLVIAVDTSVAHLAAAMGIPTWILIPFHPDWRWLESAPDSSPWYPSARLFRQQGYGNWQPSIEKIRLELLKE